MTPTDEAGDSYSTVIAIVGRRIPLPRSSAVVGGGWGFPRSSPSPSTLVARSREAKMSEDLLATSSSGLSQTALLRTPSMEEDEEEDGKLLVEDMEMAGEDELLFLNDGAEDMKGNFVSSLGGGAKMISKIYKMAKMAK
uniref:Uncharacterized protein n=1 Tax=Oryza rufipogon TaxID=4529 RepID=A0A0E0R5U0_ORYRU